MLVQGLAVKGSIWYTRLFSKIQPGVSYLKPNCEYLQEVRISQVKSLSKWWWCRSDGSLLDPVTAQAKLPPHLTNAKWVGVDAEESYSLLF